MDDSAEKPKFTRRDFIKVTAATGGSAFLAWLGGRFIKPQETLGPPRSFGGLLEKKETGEEEAFYFKEQSSGYLPVVIDGPQVNQSGRVYIKADNEPRAGRKVFGRANLPEGKKVEEWLAVGLPIFTRSKKGEFQQVVGPKSETLHRQVFIMREETLPFPKKRLEKARFLQRYLRGEERVEDPIIKADYIQSDFLPTLEKEKGVGPKDIQVKPLPEFRRLEVKAEEGLNVRHLPDPESGVTIYSLSPGKVFTDCEWLVTIGQDKWVARYAPLEKDPGQRRWEFAALEYQGQTLAEFIWDKDT